MFVFGSGFFTAIFTEYVFKGVSVENYAAKIFVLAAAIMCKAVGLITVIESYLIRVPMEGFCVCIAEHTPFTMGQVRMAFDVIFVVFIAVITPACGPPVDRPRGHCDRIPHPRAYAGHSAKARPPSLRQDGSVSAVYGGIGATRLRESVKRADKRQPTVHS